ncbi:MAG: 3-oxoacyl-ACP reductase FabG [Acetobacteraceae bacterium]
MSELTGAVALITGAARNIGRAIAVDLARGGARVVVNARGSAAEAEETARAVRAAGSEAIVHLADVTDPAAVDGLVAAAMGAFGRLDILVNNAAIRRETPFEALGIEEWREVLGVILDGAYLCSRAALAALRRSDAGVIVNIGGMSAHTGSTSRAHVITAKTGLIGLTRALAHELGPDGITVNCVVPGLIDTERKASSTSGGPPALHGAHKTLVGRRGRPDEIAAAVRYLSGPQARYVTGQTLHVNGGAYLP